MGRYDNHYTWGLTRAHPEWRVVDTRGAWHTYTRVHVGDDCQYLDRAPWSLHLDCAGGDLYTVTRGRSHLDKGGGATCDTRPAITCGGTVLYKLTRNLASKPLLVATVYAPRGDRA